MSKQLSIGIVGTSWWVDAMYLPALQNHPTGKTVALCGRNKERLNTLAREWGIPHSYTNFTELLEEKILDAIIIHN